MLIAPNAIYDTQFLNFVGPLDCNCPVLYTAVKEICKLSDTIIVAGLDIQYLWAFVEHCPPPILIGYM